MATRVLVLLSPSLPCRGGSEACAIFFRRRDRSVLSFSSFSKPVARNFSLPSMARGSRTFQAAALFFFRPANESPLFPSLMTKLSFSIPVVKDFCWRRPLLPGTRSQMLCAASLLLVIDTRSASPLFSRSSRVSPSKSVSSAMALLSSFPAEAFSR